jgi:hypothetical protein
VPGHRRDGFEFLFALDVDRSDACPQRGFDLGCGLADSGIDAPCRGNAGFERSMEFAAAHHVHARAEVTEQAEHREVCIALHGKADEWINRRERFAESLIVGGQRRGRIDERRRADLFRDRRDVDVLGVEAAGSMLEVVHARGRISGDVSV